MYTFLPSANISTLFKVLWLYCVLYYVYKNVPDVFKESFQYFQIAIVTITAQGFRVLSRNFSYNKTNPSILCGGKNVFMFPFQNKLDFA